MKITVTGILIAFVISMAAHSSAAQPFRCDDFNCPELDAAWTLVNPLGDCWSGLVGSATGQAHLTLSLPEGTPHDAWGAGGANEAVRIMQAADNVDFKIEVKFNFEPTAGYNDQGIIVEQDPNNWLRADFYNPGSGLRLFVGTTVEGSNSSKLNAVIPAGTGLYLLVERVGDTWTVSHSADGTNWIFAKSLTQSFVVSEVGVYAGNPIGALAFTSEVDWFFEQDSPIDPEDPLNTDRCDGSASIEASTWGKTKALFNDRR